MLFYKIFVVVWMTANFSMDLQLFSVTFWREDLFVPRRYVADAFWRCNILPLKKKNLAALYETRAIFFSRTALQKLFI